MARRLESGELEMRGPDDVANMLSTAMSLEKNESSFFGAKDASLLQVVERRHR